ncbi:hypothetical protein RNH31_005313 [Salmonella enterica]|nr:hypothetical protein [Salmonella enterica]ELF4900320.1 hypothetical protein [Salmonella enterica]
MTGIEDLTRGRAQEGRAVGKKNARNDETGQKLLTPDNSNAAHLLE